MDSITKLSSALPADQASAAASDTRFSRKDRVFRALGVPLDWDSSDLQSFLSRSLATDQDNDIGPVVKSLAGEIHGRSRTATVTFRNIPLSLRKSLTEKPLFITLPKSPGNQSARDQSLSLDDGFVGTTTLYTPPPDNHKVDVIALSGLGGHAFGSFKQRSGSHMWLRDSLPYDLALPTSDFNQNCPDNSIARVMVYGYESNVQNSSNMQNLEDLATMFRASLRPLTNGIATKPVILIAHSLGGLIVKQALISLSKSQREEDTKLVRAVYGIMFFGVPHEGMDIESLIPMAGDGPNRFLIESLSHINSQILSIQQREFHTALGNEGSSEIFCFYETLLSPTAQKGGNGNWAMTGPSKVLVTKSSATHCRSWEIGPEHICAVARTHSEMVKFNPEDQDYYNALETLRGLARRALARRPIPSSNARFIVPYNQNQDFVERSGILKQLRQKFGLDQPLGATRPRPRVSLYGLGGVGKTQIALSYAYWVHENLPDVSVFWVHASTAQRFEESYSTIASKCGIPGYNDPKANVLSLVKIWLERTHRNRWLMVIDNADDTSIFFQSGQDTDHNNLSDGATRVEGTLSRHIPECSQGSILVTSRNKQAALKLAPGKPPIEVGSMSDMEVHQLVCAAFGDTKISNEETSSLAARLEHLPLAIAQATAYIHEQSISIDDYIQRLDESDSALVEYLSEPFEAVGRDSETPHALTASWIISFENIKQQHPFAADILSMTSQFDRQAIPTDFVARYWRQRLPTEPGKSELGEITKALGTLMAFSFLSKGKDKTMNMHRLVQLVIRKWLITKGIAARFALDALRVLSEAYPHSEFKNWVLCRQYLPHALAIINSKGIGSWDEEIAKACLLHKMAMYFFSQGQSNDAERHGIQAVNIRRILLGEEHPDTLTSMNNLTLCYYSQGRFIEAETLGIQVMEIRKRVLGEEHPNTLTSMGNLALLYDKQGRFTEAQALGMQAMEIRKRVLGEEHPNTLISMGNLASLYNRQGRFVAAETLGIQVMEISKRVLGEEHPDTLTSMSILASLYDGQGRFIEAEALGIQMIEIRKKVSGEEHPDTLTSMSILASLYNRQGRFTEAEALGIQVMEIRKRKIGEEHPDTLTSMSNLASLYNKQGRFTESEALGIQVMEIRKRKIGEEHPDTLTSMSNLASLYDRQGRFTESEALGIQAMETSKRVLGEEHPNTLISMGNLASLYDRQGRFIEAETLGMQAMEISKRVLGEEHPNTLISMGNLALLYNRQGRLIEAETLGMQVIEISKRVLGEEHPDTLISTNNLVALYDRQGRLIEAETLGMQVIEISKRVLGEEHPDTLMGMNNIAWVIRRLGRREESVALMQDCVLRRERVLGIQHPDTVSSAEALVEWKRELL